MVNVLESQTVVVIGGTSGIGFAVAKHILQSTKANVVIASSKKDRVTSALSALIEFSSRIRGFVLDVSDPTKLESSLTEFYDGIGSFDHLVFTAGDGFSFMKIDSYNRADAEKIYNIRYYGLIECIKHALPHMPSSRNSSITFTSATLGNRPSPGWVLVGSGVSGALVSLSKGFAVELAPIRVNCVCPGVVNTELWGWLEEKMRSELFEEYSKKFLTGHVGSADEVAEAYGYLIRCTYVTGQSVTVDGGAALV
jgi:NAD(P)-dependent dehydrogenase (short-subunit alcohol dehydrogenase family)